MKWNDDIQTTEQGPMTGSLPPKIEETQILILQR